MEHLTALKNSFPAHSSHRPGLLFISLLCAYVASVEFAPSLNISQNKWTLEEGDGWSVGGGVDPRWVFAAQDERPRLGEIVPRFPLSRNSSASLGTEVPGTLNQLCFIHFIQKGSFKIQLRNHAGSMARRVKRWLRFVKSNGESSARVQRLIKQPVDSLFFSKYMEANKHLCMRVYVCLRIKAMMNKRLSRWWTVLAGGADWNTSSVRPGPLIWWRQRQRARSREAPGPQTTGAMKGPGPAHLSAVLPRRDAVLPCPAPSPRPHGTDQWIMALSSAGVDTAAQPEGVYDRALWCVWQCTPQHTHLP